jgi:ABC-type polysaccharide/polyol phosphate transport system ATPase subunit
LPTSSEAAVAADALGKDYRLGELTDVRRLVLRRIARDRAQDPRPDFHALHDVSFRIGQGEAVGILGANGSGKSTLMQLIAGISTPSAGRLEIRGRVLPLLEVGAGFHPELTGRENVVLFGTVLGLTPAEIKRAMPLIREFAELDDAHMDTPLKRYSMGMQARLSFAVAVRFPADVYIFDEVMAVVDDHFRGVAASAIRRLHKSGRTVLFISHDLDLVRDVCDRGLWLDRGGVHMDGTIEEVADAYHLAQLRGLDAEEAAASEL